MQYAYTVEYYSAIKNEIIQFAATQMDLRASQVAPVVKKPICQFRRRRHCGFLPWVRRVPGKGHGNQPQYHCLENPMNRGTWRATIHEVAKVRHN